MPSLQRKFAKILVRTLLSSRGAELLPLSVVRRSFDWFSLPAPSNVVVEPGALGRVGGLWVTPAGAREHAVLLYLHGGAYHLGSARSHRGLAGNLALAAGLRAFVAEYRLAPEHLFPAAIEDAQEAYSQLLASGIPAASIIVAGDSAGGGLALALVHALREAGAPLPGGLVLFSPWTDLALTGPSFEALAHLDPMLTTRWIADMAKQYLGGADACNPLASPLFGELQGFPPMLIQVGSEEILLDDSLRLAERARAAGVRVELQVGQGLWHGWQSFGNMLPEARSAIASAGKFMRSVFRGPQSPS